ncbi:MAG: hypothetical protein HY735_22675 [Verrucomicrobia bacterium]|nr:hypothetical protein [Verrucomicrobiota bacterium]
MIKLETDPERTALAIVLMCAVALLPGCTSPSAGNAGLPESLEAPPGFGVRRSSGAFDAPTTSKSGRGLPHSKTLARGSPSLRFTVPTRAKTDIAATRESSARNGVSNPISSHIQRGLAAIEKRDYPAAVQTFGRALKLQPANPHLHFLNGLSYHLWAETGDPGQYSQAAVGYRLALRFDPANAWAAYQLGRIEFANRRYAESQNCFSQALLVDRENPEMLYALAAASYYARDLETALGAINAAHRLAPHDELVLRGTTLVHAAAGQTGKAEESTQRYLETIAAPPALRDRLQTRIADWQRVHERGLLLADAGQVSPSLQAAPQPTGPATAGGLPARKGPRMVQIDAVLIRSEERLSARKGINLLDGLKMTFSASPVDWARGFVGFTSAQTDRQSIKLSTPDITYSLNIFNDTDTRNEVLAQPSLVAMENVQSEFFSGANLYVAITPQAGGYGSLQQVRIGLRIAVTPRFLDDDTIEITAAVDRDFIEPAAAGGSFEEFVQTASTHVTTHAVLKFDETLIVSGLSERETEMTRNGVPFLQSLPGVQYAFSRKDDLKFIKSVLVLLTPRRAHFVEEDGPHLDPPLDKPELKSLLELKRQASWLKPPHNLESVLLRLREASIVNEFRLEDLPLHVWHTPDRLSTRLKRALEFLFF